MRLPQTLRAGGLALWLLPIIYTFYSRIPECGQYAAPASFDCPINVCCSAFGFCGVTSDFCGKGCEPNSKGDGCGQPDHATCSESTDAMAFDRRIGYYELFNIHKSCNVIEPESLVIEPFSHINLAFVNFGDDYELMDEYGDVVDRMSFLKFTNSGLRINIAVGGWTFSDPPTQSFWSKMARSHENRQTFINSVVKYLQDYHLDGVDLDWEYPSAPDRGGTEDDAANYVILLAEMRKAFDHENPGWEISVTIPTSYWYLRGFDLEGMQRYTDYINLMSYDLHGMWDKDSKWTGAYLAGHTDITQIELGLDLLWRNNIDPANVVFGFAFYGRSFTMVDEDCSEPNGKCKFSTGGAPGSCTDTAGILSYAEISSRNNSQDVHTHYDPKTTVKYNVYQGSQWISYDDAQSFNDKKKFISKHCLSGWMVWAIDQDDGEFNALSGLIGEDLSSLQMASNDDGRSKKVLADAFAAYNSQNCFVTDRCTDGSSKEKNPDQAGGKKRHGDCNEGWYRSICCPKDAMPKNCEWNGAPERSEFGCDGKCGSNQFKLNQDTSLDAKGEGQCFTGARYLCCDSTFMFQKCDWTDCQGPLVISDSTKCPKGDDYYTYRFDKPNGKPWCSDTYVSPVDGLVGSPHKQAFKSGLCCSHDQSFKNCQWTNMFTDGDVIGAECKPRPCSAGKVKIAGALNPQTPPGNTGSIGNSNTCDSHTPEDGMDQEWSYCCDPPTKYNSKWPVDPKYLWAKYYNEVDESDVVWKYRDEYANNNEDDERSTKEDGTDAYGFVMLDGPEGSIDNDFSSSQTVVRRSPIVSKAKRSILTTNQTIMDSIFDHAEETFHVYCNFPVGSKECERVFIDGAEDTIISLPHHVGEGPFARIVSMKLAEDAFQLPGHHLQHRSLERISNPVYEVKVDYNFQDIKLKRDDDAVQIRVDYTNLMGYWDEMTNSPASRMKRGMGERSLTQDEWRARIQRASKRDKEFRKREEPVKVKTPMEVTKVQPEKRWYGAFAEWLKKLTTVTKSSVGVIELGLSKTINLFYAKWGCPGETYFGELKMDLEADLSMDATYAYYLPATFIPPGKPETFAYFGMEPEAYIGLHVEGRVIAQTQTKRKKIIDTLTYPGLAVKGIAAVGPTLDVYGQIRGKITLFGSLDAGAKMSFGKAEIFWPQDDDLQEKYASLLGLESKTKSPAPGTIEPVFHAGVAVDAQIDVLITPQASIGIKLVAGKTLMDAQLSGYVETDLSFQAHGDYDTSDNAFHYRFGAYLFYNIGYKAVAKVLSYIDWATGDRKAYSPDKMLKLYEKTGTIPMSASDVGKRDLSIAADAQRHEIEADIPYNSTMSVLEPAADIFRRADVTMTDPNDPSFSNQGQCPPGASGFQLPQLRFNCGWLGPYRGVNDIHGLTYDVPGLCDNIVNITPLRSKFTFAQDADAKIARYNSVCPDGACAEATTQLNKALRRSGLQLECDEFPWKSSEQGGTWPPESQRRTECVTRFQNGWHGKCLALVGQLTSNWKHLDPDSRTDPNKKDYWVFWQKKTDWTHAGNYGRGEERVYEQKLIEYDEEMPPPDLGNQGDNKKLSWAFKRDYKTDWLIPQNSLTSADWWNANTPTWYTPKSVGPLTMDSVLCALNHFGQDDVYKLPGNSASSSGSSKRDTQKSDGWEAESIEYVEDLNDAEMAQLLGQDESEQE
ncbi:hypothetical protein N7517_004790 [Penicillium concentricum]|uniref:chitinase n=1 Tax=Penicillium concentricum TaxID=293559 RepID=A0A9W9S8W7_9EURO|nr:uncharacterized protein N7517_004790 [Penicillium concentricum]KAJ5372784.1 hypothetical protein N7517_004790 [Penicillium concentricum]